MKAILKALIEAQPDECITYEQFMETVLYHPDEGYYQKPETKIGKAGDFVTSPAVHPVFGRTVARFLAELMETERVPAVVCELGAGDGRLAKAILQEWQPLHYFIVEGSPYHRQLLEERLSNFRSVQIYESLSEVKEKWPSFSGIVFSNEYFDALPIRVVQDIDGVLHEVKIALGHQGELKEVMRKCQDSLLTNWIQENNFLIRENERVEIPILMTKVIRELAGWIDHGAMLSIDYGYTDEERMKRWGGSLRGYHEHQLVEDPLRNPGNMDLTTHIHLDVFDRVAKANGLDAYFTMSQREFLLKAGIFEWLQADKTPDPFSEEQRQNRAILQLISDASFGHAFQVMCHGKGLKGAFLEAFLKRNPFEEAIKKGR